MVNIKGCRREEIKSILQWSLGYLGDVCSFFIILNTYIKI